MRSIYKTILSKFISASLIPVLFIEISLIIALFIMNDKQSQATKESLYQISSDAFSEIAERTGREIEQQFTQAKHEIAQLTAVASDFFTYPNRYVYPNLKLYYDQGFFRDGKKGDLSAIYTTNIKKLSSKDKKNLELLSLINPYVKQLVSANEDLLQGAWINLSKYYNLFYPMLDVAQELSPDLDVTQQLFYYEADPKHNPDRKIKFISLYEESWATQFGQMGAYLSPIYVHDTFIGTMGVNVTVKKAAKTFMAMKLPFNAYAMLVDKNRRLLASSNEVRSFKDTGVHSYYDNFKEVAKGNKVLPLEPINMKNLPEEEKTIFSQDIMDTSFTIMFCADKIDIVGPVNKRYKETQRIGYLIILGIALFYLLYFLFVFKSVKKLALEIYRPLSDMIDFSSHLGQSKEMTLPDSQISEINLLNKNFVSTHERLIQLVNYDSTTGLFNHQKLREDIKNSPKSVIVFFKLQNFDQYNNLFGPSVGSFALVEMVKQLQECSGNMGVMYRENKDTIAIRSSMQETLNIDSMKIQLTKIIETISREKFLFNDIDINLSIKAGISLGSREDNIDLIAQAHIALSQACLSSVENHIIYENIYEVTSWYQENLLWSKHVKDALLEQRMVPFFQPIYSYKNKRIEKFESLVRMELDGKIISPFQFLDAASSVGKLHEITLVMIDQVFAMAVNYPEMEFSINTSFDDFKDGDFIPYVKEKLIEYQIESSKIIFELLETQTFSEKGNILSVIEELKELGFKIAIDDFGTGHSNFAHVAAIDVDFIKIDGMFIKNLEDDEMSHKMVRTIVSFAQEIGALSIGEFVHNEAVFDCVESLGVDYAQGYYKSPPLSAKELKELLG